MEDKKILLDNIDKVHTTDICHNFSAQPYHNFLFHIGHIYQSPFPIGSFQRYVSGVYFVNWVLAVRLYLFPQITNHGRNAWLTTITVHVPNSFKNLRPCEDNAGIRSKEYKSAKKGSQYQGVVSKWKKQGIKVLIWVNY